jgi:hypothetical protein
VSEFKPGDRVHFEGDGTIVYNDDEGDDYLIDVAGVTSIFLACSCLTLIQRPVCVGDVLTSADPCPPKGTILRSRTGAAFRVGVCYVYADGCEYGFRWEDLTAETLTVLYVPESE